MSVFTDRATKKALAALPSPVPYDVACAADVLPYWCEAEPLRCQCIQLYHDIRQLDYIGLTYTRHARWLMCLLHLQLPNDVLQLLLTMLVPSDLNVITPPQLRSNETSLGLLLFLLDDYSEDRIKHCLQWECWHLNVVTDVLKDVHRDILQSTETSNKVKNIVIDHFQESCRCKVRQ